MQSEKAWLQWVRRAAGAAPGSEVRRPELRLGIGDDAALLRPRRGWEIALTTDLLLEDVHFLRRYDTAVTCGHRLVTRALSDLAAMGAEPLAVLVSSAYPEDLPAAWPRQLYRGILAALQPAQAVLAGGDVAAAPAGKILLDIVGVGQVPTGLALRRSGARAGDRIFVSGTLGLGARGRELAHLEKKPTSAPLSTDDRRALQHHRQPRARWELGIALRGRASAAIDLSDGLATDLDHLCAESGTGAIIDAASIPALATDRDRRRALCGGEDYELLFTVPARRRWRPPAGVTAIGSITAERGIWIADAGRRRRLPAAGWEHFK